MNILDNYNGNYNDNNNDGRRRMGILYYLVSLCHGELICR